MGLQGIQILTLVIAICSVKCQVATVYHPYGNNPFLAGVVHPTVIVKPDQPNSSPAYYYPPPGPPAGPPASGELPHGIPSIAAPRPPYVPSVDPPPPGALETPIHSRPGPNWGDNPLRKYCLGVTGQYQGPSCNTFVNCWNDGIVEQYCPPGLAFHSNSDKGFCDYPGNVDCQGKPFAPFPIKNSTDDGSYKPPPVVIIDDGSYRPHPPPSTDDGSYRPPPVTTGDGSYRPAVTHPTQAPPVYLPVHTTPSPPYKPTVPPQYPSASQSPTHPPYQPVTQPPIRPPYQPATQAPPYRPVQTLPTIPPTNPPAHPPASSPGVAPPYRPPGVVPPYVPGRPAVPPQTDDPVHLPPRSCGANEVPTKCSFPCQATCQYPNLQPCPTLVCGDPDCVCAPGYIRKYDGGPCIHKNTCPIANPSGQYHHKRKCLKPRGQFPSDICSKYLNCWDDVVIEQECPAGLLFSDTKLYCDFPENVNCQGRGRIATPLSPHCRSEYGTFVDNHNCSVYYTCAAGEVVARFECPHGLQYNVGTGICDYEYNVRCEYDQGHKPYPTNRNSINILQKVHASLVDPMIGCLPGTVHRLNPECTMASLCRTGLIEVVQCPDGLAYDSPSDKCLPAHLAKC